MVRNIVLCVVFSLHRKVSGVYVVKQNLELDREQDAAKKIG